MESKGKHSTLIFSKNVMDLTTRYDNEYIRKWDRCEENLENKLDAIYKVLDVISDKKYLFSGISLTIVFDEIMEEATQLLENSLLKVKAGSKLIDMDCKLTYVEDDFYINVTIGNNRLVNDKRGKLTPGIMADSTINTVVAVIDINDRYGFNMKKDFLSSRKNLWRMITKVGDVMENLPNLVKDGEMIL